MNTRRGNEKLMKWEEKKVMHILPRLMLKLSMVYHWKIVVLHFWRNKTPFRIWGLYYIQKNGEYIYLYERHHYEQNNLIRKHLRNE